MTTRYSKLVSKLIKSTNCGHGGKITQHNVKNVENPLVFFTIFFIIDKEIVYLYFVVKGDMPVIKSGIYDYIDVLDKAADASYLRNEVLANNIANQDTPGFKRKDVDFESVLNRELGKSKYIYLDDKIKEVNLGRLGSVSSKIDGEAYGFSYRLDRNNVDPETEQVELAANQLVYKGLIQSMGQEFNRIKSVIK